jgi:hypothetical protein
MIERFSTRRAAGRSWKVAVVALCAAPLLAGCSDVRQTFGFDRTVPDEFAVVSRAPLTVPPDYELRPPRPGAPRPQEGLARDRAAAALFEPGSQTAIATRPDGTTVPLTQGESVLLSRAGAGEADPDIRRIVDEETTALIAADDSFVDDLLFWQDPDQPGTVVDPQAEARRLRSNQALGQPLNEGEVPIIERREQAPLEGLLDGIL